MDSYVIYHESYTSALREAQKYAEDRGYFWDDNEYFYKITTGPKRPSEGKSNEFLLLLYEEEGEPAFKTQKIIVYNRGNNVPSNFELTTYISKMPKNRISSRQAYGLS